MKNVVIGLLGPTLDKGYAKKRWERWRPTVSVCMHEDFQIDGFELLYEERHQELADRIRDDIKSVSKETDIQFNTIEYGDPWDFEKVYSCLHDFSQSYNFKDDTNYYIHITTGTHVAQICLFLLTEANFIPGNLLQTSPDFETKSPKGTYRIIDLDLSRYDAIAERFKMAADFGTSFLKSGIETRNKNFNEMIDEIEQVAVNSKSPILLMGPTGAGKSQLARNIFELKKQRNNLVGEFVELNCATIRGDAAMSALFGHKKGAFTGALADRAGLLRKADKGLLFLDEVGELGLDEQAMLLRALEDKTFLPMGSDKEDKSDFQIICGTNKDLKEAVAKNQFREDLLARINLWTYTLPGLNQRKEDIEPNLSYELNKLIKDSGRKVTFNKESRDKYLSFALSPTASWTANFRDLNASITRMATLASSGRIGVDNVNREIQRLEDDWRQEEKDFPNISRIMTKDAIADIDPFDLPQLENALQICTESKSLAEAGRKLFSVSREKRKTSNDSDRLRKYLAKFELDWDSIH